jgi:hypothetical protein
MPKEKFIFLSAKRAEAEGEGEAHPEESLGRA